MVKRIYISILCILLTVNSNNVQAAKEEANLQPENDLGYFFGYSFGNMLKDGGSGDVDLDRLMQGLKDSLAERPTNVDADQRKQIYAEVRARQEAAQVARKVAQAVEENAALESGRSNLAIAIEFLQANGQREGVKVTGSGLQYEVLTERDGANAELSNRVVVNYLGSFVDGEVFDQSGDQPAEFGLQQVIAGWTEALQLMSVGDKYKLYLHPDLAYGAGSVGRIPPNSLLIFEIEILEIK